MQVKCKLGSRFFAVIIAKANGKCKFCGYKCKFKCKFNCKLECKFECKLQVQVDGCNLMSANRYGEAHPYRSHTSSR